MLCGTLDLVQLSEVEHNCLVELMVAVVVDRRRTEPAEA